MVLLSVKKETSTPISPLNTAPKESKEGLLSFSSLLKGKEATEEKIPANVLLDKDASDKTEVETLGLDPKITQTLTPQDLKLLIKEAKQFLKNKIVQSKGFKKAEIDALPKTLNGLVQVAKKFGIDVSKITLEEVKAGDAFHASKRHNPKISADDEQPAFTIKKQKVHPAKSADTNKSEIEINLVKKEIPKHKSVKSTPLFKAQTVTTPEITTQQMVNTKVNHLTSQKTLKQKSDDTLQLLLQGEKASKHKSGLKVDFSTATAKVIAPHATKESEKSLEALLKNDTSDSTDTQSKIDGLHVAKADSLEVKLNEAKQMVKYLSQDVKSSIEDYKSPFTRVKVQLNPQRLGEIDLTIVQRGKNLHINLSSNNVAINTLAMNVNDLKVQLNNNGINNASFNFNSNAQSDNAQAGQQQQQRQQQQQADEEYNYFESKERSENVVNSLEIIVPHYA